MNDLDDTPIDPAAGARPLTNMASSLSAVVDRFGAGAFFKPEEVRLLLRQDWPDSNREIDLLLAALADGIPQRLVAAHGDTALRDVLLQSVDRLTRHPSFDPTTAMWAVRTWAISLALPIGGFDAARTVGRPPDGLAASFASVVTPLAGPPREERAAKSVARPVAPPSMPAVAVSAAANAQRTTVAGIAPVAKPGPTPVGRPDPTQPAPAPPAAQQPPAPDRPAARRPLPWKTAIAVGVTIVVAVGIWLGWRQATFAPDRPAAVVAASGKMTSPTTPSTPPFAPPSTRPAVPEPAKTASPPTPVPPTPAEPAAPQPAPSSPANVSTEPKPSVSAVIAANAPTTAPAGGAEPPAIARIDVPHIPSGKPFLVAVSVVGGADRIASVERRAGAGGRGRIAPFVANAVTSLSRTPSGALLVPFKAIDAPGPVTIDFALVDRSGVRGPSRRVELDVFAAASGAPAPPVLSSAPSSATRAPCSRATCGSVVSIKSTGAPDAVEMIVRMDDRSIQTVRQSGRWHVGSRVQRIDDRYVPIASE